MRNACKKCLLPILSRWKPSKHIKSTRITWLRRILALALCTIIPYKIIKKKSCLTKIALNDLRTMTDVNSAIFFLETNPTLTKFSLISECAFESAALRNPSNQVIVLLNDSSRLSGCDSPNLDGYPNLDLYKVDFRALTSVTVQEDIWDSPLVNDGINDNFQMLSDFLRVGILNRFGGAYLDTDMISRMKVPYLDVGGKDHGIVTGDENYVYNGMMVFRRGNPIIRLIMEEQNVLANNITPDTFWGSLGSKALTKISKRICTINSTEYLGSSKKCGPNLQILPSTSAYPVPYNQWEKLFNPNESDLVRQSWNGSFAVHTWNHMRAMGISTSEMRFQEGSPIVELMKENCPLTVEAKLS